MVYKLEVALKVMERVEARRASFPRAQTSTTVSPVVLVALDMIYAARQMKYCWMGHVVRELE